MTSKQAIESREYGLAFGLLFCRYFLDSDDLHYGFWDQGLEVTMRNLSRAQERYTRTLIEALPAGVERILDVGCGAGGVADALLAEGYAVDCVSPSEVLTRYARERLGTRAGVWQSRFEDLDVDPVYDLVLFCESFQYIPIGRSFTQCRRCLRPGGWILVSDFFQTDVPERGPLGGGHKYADLAPACSDAGLVIEWDVDITAATAPTMDAYEDMMVHFVKPSRDLTVEFVRRRLPRLGRLLGLLFRKRLRKLERKHLSHRRTGDSFRHYKTYRRALLRVPGP